MIDKKITLKGFSITPESLSDRFNIELDDGEWFQLKKDIERSWSEMEFGLEKVIVDHLKNSLFQMDYKPTLVDNKLTFVKK